MPPFWLGGRSELLYQQASDGVECKDDAGALDLARQDVNVGGIVVQREE